MICENIQKIIGFDVHPMHEDSNIYWIDTPFTFADGEGISLYAESIGNTIKFFDAGETLMHFMGRGVDIEGKRGISFLTKIVNNHGVELSPAGDIQIISKADNYSNAFSSYIMAMIELVKWERERARKRKH